jgi:hypothetical protein
LLANFGAYEWPGLECKTNPAPRHTVAVKLGKKSQIDYFEWRAKLEFRKSNKL